MSDSIFEIVRIGENLLNLDELHLEKEAPSSSDISFSLNLHSNLLNSLRGLPSVINLTELNLSSNNFESLDLPELAKLPSLTCLDMSANRIRSVSNLPFLPGLTHLYLTHNLIRNLEELDLNTPDLKLLDVRGNQIATPDDVKSLAGLKFIELLFFGGSHVNPIARSASNMARLFVQCPSLKAIDDHDKTMWDTLEDNEAAMLAGGRIALGEDLPLTGGAPGGNKATFHFIKQQDVDILTPKIDRLTSLFRKRFSSQSPDRSVHSNRPSSLVSRFPTGRRVATSAVDEQRPFSIDVSPHSHQLIPSDGRDVSVDDGCTDSSDEYEQTGSSVPKTTPAVPTHRSPHRSPTPRQAPSRSKSVLNTTVDDIAAVSAPVANEACDTSTTRGVQPAGVVSVDQASSPISVGRGARADSDGPSGIRCQSLLPMLLHTMSSKKSIVLVSRAFWSWRSNCMTGKGGAGAGARRRGEGETSEGNDDVDDEIILREKEREVGVDAEIAALSDTRAASSIPEGCIEASRYLSLSENYMKANDQLCQMTELFTARVEELEQSKAEIRTAEVINAEQSAALIEKDKVIAVQSSEIERMSLVVADQERSLALMKSEKEIKDEESWQLAQRVKELENRLLGCLESMQRFTERESALVQSHEVALRHRQTAEERAIQAVKDSHAVELMALQERNVKQVAEMQSAYCAEVAKSSKLEGRVLSLHQAFQEATKLLEVSRDEKAAADAKKGKYKAVVSELSDLIQKQQATMRELRREKEYFCEELNNLKHVAGEDIEHLKLELDRTRNQCDTLREENHRLLSSSPSKVLEGRLAACQTELVRRQEELSAVRSEMEKKSESNEKLRLAVKTKDAMLEDQLTLVLSLRRKLSEFEAANEALRGDLETQTRQLRDCRDEVSDLNEQLYSMGDAERQLTQLVRYFSSHKHHRLSVEGGAKGSDNSSRGGGEGEMGSAAPHGDGSSHELDSASSFSRHHHRFKHRYSASDRRAGLIAPSSASPSVSMSGSLDLSDGHWTVGSIIAAVDRDAREIQALSDQLTDVSSKWEICVKGLELATSRAVTAEAEVTRVTARLAACESENHLLKQAIEQSKSLADEAIDELKEERKLLAKKCRQLQADLLAREQDLAKARTNVDRLKQALAVTMDQMTD